MEHGANTTVEVATLTTCQSAEAGYAGVFDLSGNVFEWEDNTEATVPEPSITDPCHIRGGSFLHGDESLRCIEGFYTNRDQQYVDIGFRCCAD
jgi:formylglycine-generating enzyme required for sulfatase activity